MSSLFTSSRRALLALRITLSTALAISTLTLATPTASALPGAPTINTISNSAGTSTISVTINFTRAASTPAAAGYIYSTDGGTWWAQCNSSNCNWTTGASSIVIQKLSSSTPSMQYGDPYQIVIAECSSGTASQTRVLAANIATLGLQSCGAASSTVNYTGGTPVNATGAPTITTSSTIAHGAVNPSITIGGSNFETSTALNLFVIDSSTTGLTPSSATFNSATSITFAFTGTARAGSISIQASSTAYAPTETSGSNTVSVTVPTTVPETPTALSATVFSDTRIDLSWSAPSYDGGSSITSYSLEYSTETVTPVTFTAISVTSGTSKNVTGLTASTSYVFRVRAVNTNGNGPYTAVSSIYTTQAASAPAPTPTPTIEAPIISKLSKDVACSRGDSLVIHGAHLKDATVTIDGIVQIVRGNSDNALNVDVEDYLLGVKTIVVTTAGGRASAPVTFKFAEKTRFLVFDIPYLYKNSYFEYLFEASGDNTYEIIGKMPDGIEIDSMTGLVYGTPTKEGKVRFNIKANGVCGNDVDQVDFEVDKEIPNAISHRIKYPNKRSNKVGATASRDLKKFLKEIKKISPATIEPIIYISGGAPKGQNEKDSPTAQQRRDAICDLFSAQDFYAQTLAGIFSGPDDEIEIFVYWPVVK